jgi:predicted ATP-dependent serine protease
MKADCTQCGEEFEILELKNGRCKSCEEFVSFLEENALQEEHECD